jgi:hypothetical protein
MNEKFTAFEEAKKMLEKYNFFGHTAKRGNKYKIEYTFLSTSWPKDVYRINTLKIDNKRIVIGVTLNDTEINGWENLEPSLNNLKRNKKK